MRWGQGRRSSNIEDRRGQSFGMSGGRLGGIGAVIVLVIALFTGIDVSQLLGPVTSTSAPADQQASSAPTDPQADFVSVILADTEDTWTKLLSGSGRAYEPPRLVLFSNATRSACGVGQAAMGPFYCPMDQRVYIDLAFFRQLASGFGAPGDFAQAYVVAHEVGHHVQHLLGLDERVRQAQSRASPQGANALQVRMELQADCFAGVWAYYADRHRNLLEPGDIEEGLRAAAAIGDDTLQRRGQGHVTPESWTHGSAAQRTHWFKVGLNTGKVASCDTFKDAGR